MRRCACAPVCVLVCAYTVLCCAVLCCAVRCGAAWDDAAQHAGWAACMCTCMHASNACLHACLHLRADSAAESIQAETSFGGSICPQKRMHDSFCTVNTRSKAPARTAASTAGMCAEHSRHPTYPSRPQVPQHAVRGSYMNEKQIPAGCADAARQDGRHAAPNTPAPNTRP